MSCFVLSHAPGQDEIFAQRLYEDLSAEVRGYVGRDHGWGIGYLDTSVGAAHDQTSAPAFVEVTAPVIAAKQCQVELDNGSGATMRVQLVGYDAADVEALSRSFWDAL